MQITTFDELRTHYQPKEGYSVYAYISKETGNFVALVSEIVEVSRFKKETMEAAKSNISTKDFKKYMEYLAPYLVERKQTV